MNCPVCSHPVDIHKKFMGCMWHDKDNAYQCSCRMQGVSSLGDVEELEKQIESYNATLS